MSSDEYDFVEIEFSLAISDTPRAWCLRVDGEEMWFPKSQIVGRVEPGCAGVVEIPRWLAEQRGLA